MRFAVVAGLVLTVVCFVLFALAAIGIGIGFLIHACVPALDLGSSVVSGLLTLVVAGILVVLIVRAFFATVIQLSSPSSESEDEDEDEEFDEEFAEREAEIAADRIAEALVERLGPRLNPKGFHRSR